MMCQPPPPLLQEIYLKMFGGANPFFFFFFQTVTKLPLFQQTILIDFEPSANEIHKKLKNTRIWKREKIVVLWRKF